MTTITIEANTMKWNGKVKTFESYEIALEKAEMLVDMLPDMVIVDKTEEARIEASMNEFVTCARTGQKNH